MLPPLDLIYLYILALKPCCRKFGRLKNVSQTFDSWMLLIMKNADFKHGFTLFVWCLDLQCEVKSGFGLLSLTFPTSFNYLGYQYHERQADRWT